MASLRRNVIHLTAMKYATCNGKWVDKIGGLTPFSIICWVVAVSDVGGNKVVDVSRNNPVELCLTTVC